MQKNYKYTLRIVTGSKTWEEVVRAQNYYTTDRNRVLFSNYDEDGHSYVVADYPAGITIVESIKEIVPKPVIAPIVSKPKTGETAEEVRAKVTALTKVQEDKFCVVAEDGILHDVVLYVGGKLKCLRACKGGFPHKTLGNIRAITMDYDGKAKELRHDTDGHALGAR